MLTDSVKLYKISNSPSLVLFNLYTINYGFLKYGSGASEYYVDHDNNVVEPLRYTSSSEPFIVEGYLFEPQNIAHSDITQDSSGKISEASLTVGNLDRQMQRFVEEYDLCGNTIHIANVLMDSSDDSIFAITEVELKISAVSAKKDYVTFSLSNGIDVLKLKFPSRRMYSQSCRWRFGGEDCKYNPAADESCERTWKDCISKKNTRNFGGFPGILNERFYI